MFASNDPAEAYRRVQEDARIAGARPAELVVMCCEQVVASLSSAVRAHRGEDRLKRSKAITRALSAITVLEIGIDRSLPIAGALMHMYAHARDVVLASVSNFNIAALEQLREDFSDLVSGFAGAHVEVERAIVTV